MHRASDALRAAGDVDFSSRWRARLWEAVTELADELQRVADDGGFEVEVIDEAGAVLWIWRRMARGRMAPAPLVGEHSVERRDGCVCYSAPIQDACGCLLGAIKLCSAGERPNALGPTVARMLASVIETRLRDTWEERAEEKGAPVELQCLGVAKLLVDGRPVRATLRQLEILALLALRPAGFSPGELAAEIYGDRWVAATTLKSEVCHVRRLLGGRLAARTYALLAPVKCDAVEVLDALSRGDVAAAVRRYAGPLLPQSEAPGIIAWRDQLEVAIRNAVLASDSPEPALALGEVCPYDSELHEHALRRLAPTDQRRHLALGRLHAAQAG
ncbi:helix-turn-helix domain-containing protein [Mycobacterium sp. SM1]|uniref:helix-turn-helix domain-containing protein n=1 Tax=Mycobacterium sp. SM1 TaxID=2816243 RepID=UPI001BCBC3D0|nr:helix-turn-helix domain-containing protein [Mycobacterium sp. SM1]MBS4727968.1 helix-turn-helix domain-containing protein [Mycobacterium sp. SM1]